MPKDVDEDIIEATIRRVAAAKAAQGGDGTADDADDVVDEAIAAAEAPPATADEEDPIEATIRRVATDKAARAVASLRAAVDQNESHDEPRAGSEPPALAAEESNSRPQPKLQPEPEPAPVARELKPVAPPVARVEKPSAPAVVEPVNALPSAELARIASTLLATEQRLTALADRIETLLPALERAANTPPARVVAHDTGDDDWDDTPQVSRMPIGAPPRPAILRDPSPRSATAAHLEPEVIDVRPLPKPLPPLQVPAKRGFDLLPRTYRITVEDKRRGVDLVPLHRALLSMDGVKDMSLLSYNNGVAIVSLETSGDIEPDSLGKFVSRAMSREARVEVHNEHTMVVKLAED